MNSAIDLIIRIKNGYQGKRESIVSKYSKANESILNILKLRKFVKEYRITDTESNKVIEIDLLYNGKEPALTNVRIFSKPGRRIYRGVSQLRPVVGGFGIAIVSTPKGLMTNSQAKKENVGGELLFEIW